MATFRTVWSRVCTSIQIHVDIVKVVVCYLVHLDLIDRGSIILQTSFDRRVFSCRGLKQISESFSVIEADTGGRFNSVSHEPSALRLVPRNPPPTANFCKKDADVLLYLSGVLAWCCWFCSASLCSHECRPSTCGVLSAVPSESSPFWPGSPAVGGCTSPPTPAGGAVRPGR